MKTSLSIALTLLATQVIAQNTILQEHILSADEVGGVSTLKLSSCELEILNVSDASLREKSKDGRLMQIKVAGKSYFASSIALFERDENRCEVKMKGLVMRE